MNWLIRSLRKQLAIAREARRVDVLCEHLSLSHKMVKGSERYRELANIINSAVKILEEEVGGALDQVSEITGRGIVNRPQPQVCSEEITPFSVLVVLKYQDNIAKAEIDGCKVWHRSANMAYYPAEPTCHGLRPNTRTLVSGLITSTKYFFKILPFGCSQGYGEWEGKCSTRSLDHGSSQCSTQNSESVCIKEDLTQQQKSGLNLKNKQRRAIQYDSPSTNSSENNRSKFTRLDGASDNDGSQLQLTSEVLPFVSSNSSLLEVPSKPDWLTSTPDFASKNHVERQYEYSVKVIIWLEHEGHMDKDFHVKFLTLFSLKASAKERRIVNAFIDALISDPASLVAQLIHSFMEVVCSKERPALPNGGCCYLCH
uniref:Fibronectin type-III domain-containing protein n=1 Tax=Leersia perrieri TaxID=77586 RepID=A0A0D9X5F9_9ORYZ